MSTKAPEESGIETIGDDPAAGTRSRASFEEFYEREFSAVLALVYVLSGSNAGAEDIAQEAFLAAHRSWERVAGLERPGAWVRRVAANHAVSAIRRRVSEARALLRLGSRRETPMPELSAETEEFWGAVRSLPKRQAEVLALFYLEDLPIAQVADVLGMAEGTVKAHLHAGRRSLAARLRVEDEEEA